MKKSVLKSLKDKILIGMKPMHWTEEERDTAKKLIKNEIKRIKNQ